MEFQHWSCPHCRQTLSREHQDLLFCSSCRVPFERRSGIWRFLSEEQRRHFALFLEDYRKIRRAEGRGSTDSEFYRLLPEQDQSGNFTDEWKIRAASFRELSAGVVAPLAEELGRPLLVADLGAGNCWLSHRLAELGHGCLAVDIRDDAHDGLGCHTYYCQPMVPVEAAFSHLPFAAACLDLVIFNASVHYSEDLEMTLREALRVVLPGGRVVILDSPIYRDGESGRQMVREREVDFQNRFGTASSHLKSEHFLTWQRLDDLGGRLGIRWELRRPGYGLAWRLRPWRARLRRRREPAVFGVLVGRNASPKLAP